MPVWVGHSYYHHAQAGDAASPLVLGNGDDHAGDEDTVEMEESPEGEESHARAWRAPMRPTMKNVEGHEVCHVPYGGSSGSSVGMAHPSSVCATQPPNQFPSEGAMETTRESSVLQRGGDEMDDQSSRKRWQSP